MSETTEQFLSTVPMSTALSFFARLVSWMFARGEVSYSSFSSSILGARLNVDSLNELVGLLEVAREWVYQTGAWDTHMY